jgi:hypothetical protein
MLLPTVAPPLALPAAAQAAKPKRHELIVKMPPGRR